MKTNLFASLLVAICAATAFATDLSTDIAAERPAIALKRKLHSLLERSAGLESSLHRRLSEDCGQSLNCTAHTLPVELDEFFILRSQLTGALEPLTDFCDSVTDLESRAERAVDLRKTLHTAFGIAKLIPTVGSAFTVPQQVLGQFKTPLETIESKLNTATSAVIGPWDASIGNFMTKLADIEEALNKTVTSAESFGKLFDSECMPDTVDLFIPGFSSTIDAVKTAAYDFKGALKSINSAMESLISKLTKQAWRRIVNRFNTFTDSLNVVLTPFDELKVLDELMDEEITIPWVGNFKDKQEDGLPRFCPDGYQKSDTGLACIESCPSGWSHSTDFNCMTKCPSGYSNSGLACKNKHYHVRHIKSRKWNGKCNSGYSGKGLVCWKKCPDSSWRDTSFAFFGVCYKSCPLNMNSDPTRAFCLKRSRSRGSGKTLQCRNGYNFYGVVCMEKCGSGEVDGGVFCYVPQTKTFTIRDIADALDDVMSKIEDLPVYKEIMDEIEKLVKSALKFVLDRLDLPSPDDLVDVPAIDVGSLPVVELDTSVNDLNIPDIDGLVDVNSFDGMFNNLFGKLGVSNPLDFANCAGDFNCVTDMLGIESFPFPEGFNMSNIASAYQFDGIDDEVADFSGAVNGCKRYEEKEIDFPKHIANVLGIEHEDKCQASVNVCVELDINQDAVDKFLNGIKSSAKPFVDFISAAFAQGEDENAASGRRLANKVVNKDNWEMSIPAIPFTWLFPKFRIYNAHTYGVSWFSVDTMPSQKSTSSYLQWEMERTNLYISVGKKYGQDYARVDFRVGMMLSYMHSTLDLRDLMGQSIDMFQRSVTKYDGEYCALQWDESAFNSYNCQTTHPDFDNEMCRQFCILRHKAVTLTGWDIHKQPNWVLAKSDSYFTKSSGKAAALKVIDQARRYIASANKLSAKFTSRTAKTGPMIKRQAKKAVSEPKMCIYQHPKVGDFTMDFGVRGLARWNTDYTKLGGFATAEVKFNVADFEGSVTPSEAFKCLYFGMSKAIDNPGTWTRNYKPRWELGVNVGFEVLIADSDVTTNVPTGSPTTSAPTGSPTTSAPTGSPTQDIID